MTTVKFLQSLLDQCESNAEYNQGYDSGYAFDSLAAQIKAEIDRVTAIPEEIIKVAERLRKLPSGRYRSWSLTGSKKHGPYLNQLVGYFKSNQRFMMAIKILQEEGIIRKVKIDGTDSKTGPYWELSTEVVG